MYQPPEAPIHVNTVRGGGVTVRVWLDTGPDARAVLVHLPEYGQELHIPIEVARGVAESILAASALSDARKVA